MRILFLADSHLGLDLPARPRSARRRRGHDFLENHTAALERALEGDVDVVVHGGDVFDRPRVHETLAWQAMRPLVRVAEAGVPVFIVPGNHERAKLPHARFAEHPHVHVFDRPRTFTVDVRAMRIAFSGFPFERGDVRARFPDLVERTGWREHDASLRLLCMHQCAEGATVGPGDFTFTTARDVIRVNDVPASFAAVLSGHIHRRQVITTDLRRRPLSVPVLYPGSVERTSFAEMGETKGWIMVHVDAGDVASRVRWEFCDLYARPMLAHDITVSGLNAIALDDAVRAIVSSAPHDAVLRIRIRGDVAPEHLRVLRAAHVRSFTPVTMNLEIRAGEGVPFVRRRVRAQTESHGPMPASQLDLGIAP